eukprot:gnl/MRDRNA2_/MRDRNA2_99961_c0_seq1.p1 gnl/MRDRNA2_/MRDRNA2_99961_c0~~gnl/MRDRNA2_/MRDRNA2_99961_c0_seq1.p1  ORF type:complete len:387 (-),score=115.47 gnl/MRDRNA2_/MRDRNA2_99961_c0_seq1:91-1191(-)
MEGYPGGGLSLENARNLRSENTRLQSEVAKLQSQVQELTEKAEREASVREALHRAVAKGDHASLLAAVAASKGLFGDAETAWAERSLEQLHAEEGRRRAEEDARLELREALRARKSSRLAQALAKARSAQLQPSEMAAAESELAKLKALEQQQQREAAARSELRRAEASGSVEAFGSAIAKASTELPKHEIQAAERSLQGLEERARRRKQESEARKQIDAALSSGNIEDLRAAVRHAQMSGLAPREVEIAASALADAEHKAHTEQDLREEIRSTIEREDVGALDQALAKAKKVGLPAAELDTALGERAKLANLKQARQRLEEASAARDPQVLRSAIEDAKRAGMPRKEISRLHAFFSSRAGNDTPA